MNYLAEKYQQRRKTIPWTQAECDAFQREHDIDPTGEYGLRILDRHLQAIDRVKLLCKQNPNKPKVREAILAEYRSFAEDIAAIGKEAADKFKEMKMASSNFKPLRSENPEVSPDFFEEFIRSIRYGNILVRSIKVDETPKMVAEVDVATAWAKSRLHVHGRLEVAGKFETQEGRIDLKEPPPHVKCIVKDCENHMDQGTFVGEICYSCYEHMTTGKVGPTTSILRKIREAELFTLKGPDGKIVTQGQFNALMAENAALKERLAETKEPQ